MKAFGGGQHGPNLDGSRRRTGLLQGCFYNLCTAICSCCYVFTCCWLVEDCFSGQRSFPWPAYGSERPPPPPPPPVIGHHHYGPPQGPTSHPGPYGFPTEQPPPPPYR